MKALICTKHYRFLFFNTMTHWNQKRTKNWRHFSCSKYKIKVYLLNQLISRNVSVFFVCEGRQFVYLFEFVEKILCKIWGFDVVVFFLNDGCKNK